MANTTIDLDTRRRGPIKKMFTVGVAAATKIFCGAMVGLNAAGHAVKGDDTAAIRIIGRAAETVDNTGAAAALRITVEEGVFEYTMTAAAIAVGQAVLATNVGKVFADDDQTVGLAADVANAIVAGRAVEIDLETGKLWVEIPASSI